MSVYLKLMIDNNDESEMDEEVNIKLRFFICFLIILIGMFVVFPNVKALVYSPLYPIGMDYALGLKHPYGVGYITFTFLIYKVLKSSKKIAFYKWCGAFALVCCITTRGCSDLMNNAF